MLQVIVATFPHFEPIGTDSTPCNAKSPTEEVKLACLWAKALDTRGRWQREQATGDDVVEELLKVNPVWRYVCRIFTDGAFSSQRKHKLCWPWQQAHTT